MFLVSYVLFWRPIRFDQMYFDCAAATSKSHIPWSIHLLFYELLRYLMFFLNRYSHVHMNDRDQVIYIYTCQKALFDQTLCTRYNLFV